MRDGLHRSPCVARVQGPSRVSFFFFNDTATTEIYTLSLHDALPIWSTAGAAWGALRADRTRTPAAAFPRPSPRSEEHTSELQSRLHLVCRLLLEKKKTATAQEAYLFQMSTL